MSKRLVESYLTPEAVQNLGGYATGFGPMTVEDFIRKYNIVWSEIKGQQHPSDDQVQNGLAMRSIAELIGLSFDDQGVLSFSTPSDETFTVAELIAHLQTLPRDAKAFAVNLSECTYGSLNEKNVFVTSDGNVEIGG